MTEKSITAYEDLQFGPIAEGSPVEAALLMEIIDTVLSAGALSATDPASDATSSKFAMSEQCSS